MKTNKILGTLALAALAAACSNEEFEAVNNSPALNGRVELGQISLTVAGADTRWDIGANFNDLLPEVGDALGACLVDAPNATNSDKDAKLNYDLTDYISTNYAFKFDGSKYVSEAKMVEGNYVFYAPYNAAHATRKPIVAKLNPVQQLNAAEDGSIDALSTIKQLNNSGEVVLVGHKFISKDDDKTVSAVLKPIYAYPLITLKNSYKPLVNSVATPTDLVVNQIVIENGSQFATEASLKFNGAASETAITASAGVVNELRDFTYWKSASKPSERLQGDWITGKGNNANYTADLMSAATGESSAIIVKAPANSWTLKAGESTQFYVVVPAAATSISKINVYTNKGVFTKNVTTTAIAAGKRYPIAEYNADGSLIVPSEGGAAAPGDGYKFEISGSPSTNGDNVVASSSDLATLVANFTGTTLNVVPLNKDVTIDSSVANAFSAKGSSFTLVVKAPITIAASLTTTNKTVDFQDDAYITAGTISLSSNIQFTGSGKKLIVKGGNVTVGATFTNATLLVKGGEVTLASAADATVEDGKLTLSSTTSTKTITVDGEDAEVTLTAGTQSAPKSYAATIVNTEGAVTIPTYTTIAVLKNSDSAENNGTVTDGTNDGYIANYGIITAIENSGIVDMKSASASVTVDGSSHNGKIKNNVDATSITKTDTSNKIYYEFNADVNGKLVPKCSNYDMIYLNQIAWNPEASQIVNADIWMTNATIAIYDQETKIGVNGTVIVENTASNKASYLKGNNEAFFWAKGKDESATYVTFTITGPGNIKWDWNGTDTIQ